MLRPKPATNIEWRSSTMTLDTGTTSLNYVDITPSDATNIDELTATSSNSEVATVTQDTEDKTKFTIAGVTAGEVTITATLGELTDTFTVTVEQGEVELTSAFFVNTSDVTLRTGGTTTRALGFLPENATTGFDKIQVRSGDQDISVRLLEDYSVEIKSTGFVELSNINVDVGTTTGGTFTVWSTIHVYVTMF